MKETCAFKRRAHERKALDAHLEHLEHLSLETQECPFQICVARRAGWHV